LIDLSQNSIWSLQDSRQLMAWLGGLGWLAFLLWLRYIPIGFLAARTFLQDQKSALGHPLTPALSPKGRGTDNSLARSAKGRGSGNHEAQGNSIEQTDLRLVQSEVAGKTAYRIWSMMLGLVWAVAMSVGVRAVEFIPDRRWPHCGELLLPVFGCIVGVWM